jgi:hypothetical protein
MKSLIKQQKRPEVKAAPKNQARPTPPPEPKVAQCCAKVSRAVAGCHD